MIELTISIIVKINLSIDINFINLFIKNFC